MPATSDRAARRRKILLLLVLVLAVVFALQFSGLSFDEVPTGTLIEEQAKQLRTSRKLLAKLSQEDLQDENHLAELRVDASPFWTVESEAGAIQEIRANFDRIARKAMISKQQVFSPDKADIPNYDYLYEVTFSVTITATMKEITRLLYEMERADHVFQWTQCSITVTNRRNPTEVRLNGKVRAVVLRPEAQAILASREEGRG